MLSPARTAVLGHEHAPSRPVAGWLNSADNRPMRDRVALRDWLDPANCVLTPAINKKDRQG